jgi:hypothetical protein
MALIGLGIFMTVADVVAPSDLRQSLPAEVLHIALLG